MEPWNDETIKILNNVRINSLNLSEYHRRNYFSYKYLSNWFDLPVICISTIAGSFSVGATPYLEQGTISVITCSASMLITILSSIKMDIVTLQNDGRFIEISEVYNIYINGGSNLDYSIENIRKELIGDMNQQIKEGNLMKALKRKYSILNLENKDNIAVRAKMIDYFNSPIGY